MSNIFGDRDPRKPLPGEVTPGQKQLFQMSVAAIVLVAAGVMLGLWIDTGSSPAPGDRVAQLEGELAQSKARIQELELQIKYQSSDRPPAPSMLRPTDRRRHEIEGRRYTKALRNERHNNAADLVDWFVARWNQLLDQPQPNDRIGRRAATLSLLIGGMSQNLNPGDYVPWQAEFLSGRWLGELHFDIDGDGLPGKRSGPNTHDSFANVSVCQVAMAINQAVTDARVLMMPDMQCDRPYAKISVFLQGATFDDAISEFVRVLKQERFLVKESVEKNVRLVLVGSGSAQDR